MSLYSKKLHIIKNGVQEDINLYTTTDEINGMYLGVQDDITIIYAKLATTEGTSLHVDKNGTIYNVIKEAIVHSNKMITTNDTFVVPDGVTSVSITASAGGGGGGGSCGSYNEFGPIADDGTGRSGSNGGNTSFGNLLILQGGGGGGRAYTTDEKYTPDGTGISYGSAISGYEGYRNGGSGIYAVISSRAGYSGGHGGTCIKKSINVTSGQSIVVTIGNGGAGGTGGTPWRSSPVNGSPGTNGFMFIEW